MTIEEMKNLKLGDVLQDLQLLKNVKREIFCVVCKVENDMVTCISLKKEDEGHYPHNFHFNEYDCVKISNPIYNINNKIYSTILKHFRSVESFDNKAFKR